MLIGASGVVAAGISPVDDEGRLVNFNRDIAPIFRERCLECHNEDNAKNDFRIDQWDSVSSYVEPEDVEGSSMFVDYMVSDDPDMLMPPPSHNGPLPPSDLALVRLWIEEGAIWPDNWPDNASVVGVVDIAGAVQEAPATMAAFSPATSSIGMRMWMAQGFLHPATVHFPVALLLLGGVFVVIGWKFPSVGTQIPLACLLIGAATSVAASMMGWSFAGTQGYGGWTKMNDSLFDQPEIFWHRWSAVILTTIAVASAGVALWSLRKPTLRATKIWKSGLLVCALLVGAVGHQGGEMTYGKGLYADMFDWVLGRDSDIES